MTILEKAVLDLANALETLESKVEGRLDDQSARAELSEAAKRQARTAREHATEAGRDLAGAIDNLKSLLDAHGANPKG